MTRGIGTALALSVVAHGGVVATVGIVGVAWLGGSPSTPPRPALFVDLVEAVVATSDRIGGADASAPRPGNGAAVPTSRARAAVAPSVDAPPAAAGRGAPAPDLPRSVAAPVPDPPAAPVLPAPRTLHGEPTPESPAGPVPQPGALAPSTTLGTLVPAPSAAPPITSAPAGDTGPRPPERLSRGPVDAEAPGAPGGAGLSASGPAAPPSAGPSPGNETGKPAAASAGRDSATEPGAPPGEAVGAGSRSHAQRGATDVARLVPGAAREASEGSAPGAQGGLPEGAIPPEYESYVRVLRQRVADRLVYPWIAARRGQQGVVELELHVSSEGRLVGVEAVAGSTADVLRAAAVAAVRGAAPFPFPSGVEGRPLVIRLPVEFRLR